MGLVPDVLAGPIGASDGVRHSRDDTELIAVCRPPNVLVPSVGYFLRYLFERSLQTPQCWASMDPLVVAGAETRNAEQRIAIQASVGGLDLFDQRTGFKAQQQPDTPFPRVIRRQLLGHRAHARIKHQPSAAMLENLRDDEQIGRLVRIVGSRF